MKKRRVLAAFFGVLAAAGAAVTLTLGLTARDREMVVLKEDTRIMVCAQDFLDDFCSLNLAGASEKMLGEPALTVDTDQTGAAKILWDRYWGGLEGTLEGEPYAQGSFLAVNARITYPDMAEIIRRTGELTQTLLAQKTAEALSVAEVYDAQGGYRQDVLDEVLVQAARTACAQTTAVCEKNVTLKLVYDGENWKIVSGKELRDLLSGTLEG